MSAPASLPPAVPTGAHVGAASESIRIATTSTHVGAASESIRVATTSAHVGAASESIRAATTSAHVGAASESIRVATTNAHVGAASNLDAAVLRAQTKDALVGLGWKPAIACAAVAAAATAMGPEMTLERLIFEALRQCPGGKRDGRTSPRAP